MAVTKLYIVVPCYNEQEALPAAAAALREKLSVMIAGGAVGGESRIVFVDDGSSDRTWSLIEGLHRADPLFRGIRLSRNAGQQNALAAGLVTLCEEADAFITIDADLQDDVAAIDEMLRLYEDGCDVVYGVRSKRETDTFFKRAAAEGYYRVLDRLGAKVIFNHADFRLMSKRAVSAFADYRETNLFLRGLVPMIGYRHAIVTYERRERRDGKSKYTIGKMLALAWEGVTSLTNRPLKLITRLGLIIFIISVAMLIYTLIRYLCGATVTGWASLAVSIWAIGGLQLLAIGVIGEYIGKIYLETKRRPRWHIEQILE